MEILNAEISHITTIGEITQNQGVLIRIQALGGAPHQTQKDGEMTLKIKEEIITEVQEVEITKEEEVIKKIKEITDGDQIPIPLIKIVVGTQGVIRVVILGVSIMLKSLKNIKDCLQKKRKDSCPC